MKIVLISTSDMKGGRADVRDRMLQSLVESERTLQGDSLVLALLLQNCTAVNSTAISMALPAFVRPVLIPGRVPLSSARNILLRQLLTDGDLVPDTLVAFPDDDCWYPPGFLREVAEIFAGDAALDFWFCRYASQPVRESFAAEAPKIARIGEVVRNASSNTIFLRGRVVTAIGQFDEELGVGTPVGGAEDVDYALRARLVARKIAYRDAALVGHRDKARQFRARYWAGGLTVLARHARDGTAKLLVRGIGVGCYLVIRRELALRDFTAALSRAVNAWRAADGREPRPFDTADAERQA
jgi:hypothetical protein